MAGSILFMRMNTLDEKKFSVARESTVLGPRATIPRRKSGPPANSLRNAFRLSLRPIDGAGQRARITSGGTGSKVERVFASLLRRDTRLSY